MLICHATLVCRERLLQFLALKLGNEWKRAKCAGGSDGILSFTGWNIENIKSLHFGAINGLNLL